MNKGDKKAQYQNWAIGFMYNKRRTYHPYLKIGFIFDCDKK